METKAHYALVGFFALALAAAGALFAVWLGQIQFDREFAVYDVVFEGPVRGLTDSSEVRFNGIKVGEVTRLGLDRDDPTRVIAKIRVDADTPLREDSIAQLEPQGLTGLSYIQVSAGTPEAARLDGQASPPARIQSKPAQLDILFGGGEDVVQDTQEALQRFNALLSEKNLAEISRAIENIRFISETMRENAGMIENANETLASLDQAAKDFSAFSVEADRMVREDLTPMLAEAEQASIDVDLAAKEFEELLAGVRGPVDRFANVGLDELTLALGDIRRLAAALEVIALELEENPAGFVAGSSRRKEIEVPQ
jgi:phospholipid/cholesterol/gamma-HCH transport system substrate-binding protein